MPIVTFKIEKDSVFALSLHCGRIPRPQLMVSSGLGESFGQN